LLSFPRKQTAKNIHVLIE